jgi:CheY-like chemotaxis protein
MCPERSKVGSKLGGGAGFSPAGGTFASVLALTIFVLFAHLACGQGSNKPDETVTASESSALQREADSIEKVFTNALVKLENQKSEKSSLGGSVFWTIVGGGLLGLVVLVRYIPGLLEIRDASYQARLAAAKAAAQVMPEMAAEEKAFSAFAATFSSGPVKAAGESIANSRRPEAEKQETISDGTSDMIRRTAPTPAKGASNSDPATPPLRKLLQDLGDATNPAIKDDLLRRAFEETKSLRVRSEAAGHTLVWKLAAALEALLNQLIAKPRSVNASTLCTASAAMDLIEDLDASPTRPDLAERPPIRVLAVDDDSISRHAISFTLKTALALPELASDGAAGLQLATQNSYDAIFLDVQMPGMNGFDLCVKIRQTELNRTTPIVFITCQNDFSARSRSSVVGGQDLIAKPFLTFEVALKALTLVIQHRLRNEPLSKPAVCEAPAGVLAAVS